MKPAAVLLASCVVTVTLVAVTSVVEFPPLPIANAAPTAITKAPDGTLWFTEKNANRVARLTTARVLTEYAVPTPSSGPERITVSPDGYVWFTELYGRKIGRLSQTGGTIAEYVVPGVGAFPTAITTDLAGKVWFASSQQPGTGRLGSISLAGTITMLPTSASNTYIAGMTAGPDGNLWITQVSSYWGDSVARVVRTGWGSFTNFRLPNASSSPQGITVGPDNNLWLTEKSAGKIARITTQGNLTEFALSATSGPQQITAGADGALWFTEQTSGLVGRMSIVGLLSEVAVPTLYSQPFGITSGADGKIYFTEQASAGNRVGVVAW